MRVRNALYFAAFFGLSAAAAPAQDRGERFVQRDGNGDGVLTPHEYQSTGGHPGNFRALDRNGDGVLSHGEFVGRGGVAEQAYAVDEYEEARQRARDNEAVRVERSSRARAARSRSSRGSDGIARRTLQRMAPLGSSFDVKDRNRDGLLTRAEYGDRRTFTRVDRNRDGRISYDEFLNPPAR